ncbi:MAG TPA: DUF1192 domain-containing protein [Xanthobacteraceae bacterium]|jgi:uncharacterized small protein (DUF1192 family)
MAMEEELPKKPSKVHEIGSDLSLLSVHELRERVEALQAEIERLEATMKAKEATKNAADTFFRR